jgi:hypothetical protein
MKPQELIRRASTVVLLVAFGVLLGWWSDGWSQALSLGSIMFACGIAIAADKPRCRSLLRSRR